MCFIRYVSCNKKNGTKGGDDICKSQSQPAGTRQLRGLLLLDLKELLPGKCVHFCYPPRAANTHRGVGPAADGAGVDLGVFHCVCSQVYLQGGGIRVRTVAVVALERFVFVVLPSVGLEGCAAGWRKEKASAGKEASISTGEGFPSDIPFQPGPKLPRPPSAKGGTPGS